MNKIKKTCMRSAVLFLTILIFILPVPNNSRAFLGDTYGSFGLDAAFGFSVLGADYSRLPEFWVENGSGYMAKAYARLMAAGRPLNSLAFEIHLIQNLSSYSSEFGLDAQRPALKYRLVDARWEQARGSRSATNLDLDRLNLKITMPWLDLTLGRQAVTFGKAYFWNPLDVFLPFGFSRVNRDYKPGVDAVRLDVPLGNFSGINLVWSPGRKLNPSGDAYDHEKNFNLSQPGWAMIGRFFTNLSQYDLTALGGKVYGGYLLGAGVAGEAGYINIRLEAAYFWAEENQAMPFPFKGRIYEDYLTVVAGLGRRFENTLSLEVEYLYNSLGEGHDLSAAYFRFEQGVIQQAGRHIMGANISYDILPILVGQIVFVYSFSDNSALLSPRLTLSLSDESELIMGAAFSFGKRPQADPPFFLPVVKSEFGTYPDFYFFEFKYYF